MLGNSLNGFEPSLCSLRSVLTFLAFPSVFHIKNAGKRRPHGASRKGDRVGYRRIGDRVGQVFTMPQNRHNKLYN